MKLSRVFPFLTVALVLVLSSCFGNSNDTDYTQWRALNTKAFNDSMALKDKAGNLVYSELTPVWDQSFSILMRWHNDRSENVNKVNPLSNSTCHVKYTLTTVEGDTLDSSPSFTCVPNNMVTGFMAALMNMETNDTVTAILPYTAGYGVYGYGGIRPYTTLVFAIRLDSISKLM